MTLCFVPPYSMLFLQIAFNASACRSGTGVHRLSGHRAATASVVTLGNSLLRNAALHRPRHTGSQFKLCSDCQAVFHNRGRQIPFGILHCASLPYFANADWFQIFQYDSKQTSPRCRHLANSTKQCCLTFDWFSHLANGSTSGRMQDTNGGSSKTDGLRRDGVSRKG